MRIFFYSPNRIEPWDWRNLNNGIGGSETSHIEMAWRLAQNYEVVSFTDLPDAPNEWRGVQWLDLSQADFADNGLWIVYRNLACMDDFEPTYNRRAWLVCQDVDYPDWTDERAVKFERIIALCRTHQSYLQVKHPAVKDTICLSSNGIRVEEWPAIERNPKRLIYSSSPDRGLAALLKIFERAREQIEDLELHIFYGLDNIDRLTKTAGDAAYWKPARQAVEQAQQMAGVFWRGRVGQAELYQEFMKSGIWCYPTDFTETSCITSMEAQCNGAIPITRPYWALLDNVQHGVFIDGSPANDALVRARYVDAIVRLAANPAGQETVRQSMMLEARTRCDWQRVVEQWQAWL